MVDGLTCLVSFQTSLDPTALFKASELVPSRARHSSCPQARHRKIISGGACAAFETSKNRAPYHAKYFQVPRGVSGN